MRTTLTLDDDLAGALKKRAHATGRSFKAVVNEAIRRGLSTGSALLDEPEPFRVQPHSCGFRPGIDTAKLNQLVDELELEEAAELPVHETPPESRSDEPR